MDHQPGMFDQGRRPEEKQPKTGMAVMALVFGLFALIVPVAVVDVIVGVAGIFLGWTARQSGAGGLATAGLVVSAIGTMVAISFTLTVFGII